MTLLLYLASPLKPTLISLVLNISAFDNPSYIYDPLSIFIFNDIGSLTLYQDLDS